MFLRSTTRLKDGKEHYYWSIVENRRCRGERVVQQTVLYLGEINDSQREQWIRAIEVFDEDAGAMEQLKLFAAERRLLATARKDRQRPTNSLNHEQHQVRKGDKGASKAVKTRTDDSRCRVQAEKGATPSSYGTAWRTD
jgi:hypothetical protein